MIALGGARARLWLTFGWMKSLDAEELVPTLRSEEGRLLLLKSTAGPQMTFRAYEQQ